MMKYLEYHKRYTEYRQSQDDLNDILNEWVLAFQRTQPKSMTYGDKVQRSVTGSVLDDYVIELEDKRLRERIKAAEEIMDVKARLLEISEKELRRSRDIYDIIYACKWIDGMKPKDIYRKIDLMGISYSESRIYEITRTIKRRIGEA